MLLNSKGEPIYERKSAHIVIFVSEDGESNWAPITYKETPKWLQHPDILGELLNGNICCDPTKDGRWYRAVKHETH